MKNQNKKCSTDFSTKIPWNNKEFHSILDFYLLRCPVPHTSNRSKSFKELGFVGSGSFAKLKKRLLSCSDTLDEYYFPCEKNLLEEKFTLVHELSLPIEYCVFLNSDGGTVMNSLFKAIRNALAHGSFTIQKYNQYGKFYYFENFDNYKKAEIVLSEDTLLKWIKLIEKNE